MLNINVYSIHFYMMFFYPAVWNWICIIVVSQKAGSSKNKGNLFIWKYNVSISYPLRPLTPHYLTLFPLYIVSLFHAFRVVSHITGSKSKSNRYANSMHQQVQQVYLTNYTSGHKVWLLCTFDEYQKPSLLLYSCRVFLHHFYNKTASFERKLILKKYLSFRFT